MISLPLFSVMIEQKLNLATLITAVIAVLAWVFPFPDIGEKDKNDKDNQQEKAPKRNYYLNSLTFSAFGNTPVSMYPH